MFFFTMFLMDGAEKKPVTKPVEEGHDNRTFTNDNGGVIELPRFPVRSFNNDY